MFAITLRLRVDGCLRFVENQVGIQPPTFALFTNRSSVPESYLRFLSNSLREEFGFLGVPVRLVVRAPSNPYSRKKQ